MSAAISHIAETHTHAYDLHPLYPVVVVVLRRPGYTHSLARQTGAGEHRLGATLAAGGAATAAAAVVGGRLVISNKQ